MDELYPFLRTGGEAPDLARLLAEAATSSRTKAVEIEQLRRSCLEEQGGRLQACAERMAAAFAAGATLWAFGNGGSATDAQSVANAFETPGSGGAFPARCIAADVAVLTALANDVGIDVVFARQLHACGGPGDIALGLSTSGNSGNVLRAFDQASALGMLTVGFAGGDGGQMATSDAIDHLFVVPSSSVHRIQEAQTTMYHVLRDLVHHARREAVPA